MSNEAKPCTQCAANCRRETARSMQGAFARYTELFAQGHLPTLCQQHDGSFNVCYAEEKACTARPLRAAEAIA